MAKYKNTKQIAKAAKSEKSDSRLHAYLIAIPLIALLIKFIIMGNIQAGGWLGADGENYTMGVDGLIKDGFFSEEPKLSYWPAGYPILLWPIAAISVSKFFYIASFLQSIFFAYSTYFFTNKLRNSSLKYLAFWASMLITFNPTLSLSSLAIGYEAPIASCFMMIAGLILANLNPTLDKKFWLSVTYVGGWFALATFMQPRFLLIAIIVAIMWAVKVVGAKNRIRIAALITAIMMVAPGIMIFRNSVVIDKVAISTNISPAFTIGAGPETSGGYKRSGPEVPCQPNESGVPLSENEVVMCVIKWYFSNPVDTIRLSVNKSLFFWSPWSGPKVEGTMARNPWLKISPAHQITIGSQGGRDFIYSGFGIAVSYGWIIGQMLFLFIGFRSLRKLGESEKFFANIVMIPIVLSWLISIGTIGDHRFRIPTMSMSIFLQVAAFLAIRKKLKEKVG
jgi:hypothetical protein